MSAQRNFDTPPKNWGIFMVVPPRHGRTQRRIYDLFFVRGFVVYCLVWAKKVPLAAICLVAGSASFGIREN